MRRLVLHYPQFLNFTILAGYTAMNQQLKYHSPHNSTCKQISKLFLKNKIVYSVSTKNVDEFIKVKKLVTYLLLSYLVNQTNLVKN